MNELTIQDFIPYLNTEKQIEVQVTGGGEWMKAKVMGVNIPEDEILVCPVYEVAKGIPSTRTHWQKIYFRINKAHPKQFRVKLPKISKTKPVRTKADIEGLFNTFRYFIGQKNWEMVNQTMLQFNEKSDNNELKTILVITKGLQDFPITENRQRVKDILKEKMGDKFI